MDESDFEGSLVLEKLAAVDRIDAFYDAVDSEDLLKVTSLLKNAGVDSETIAWVLRKIADPEGEH